MEERIARRKRYSHISVNSSLHFIPELLVHLNPLGYRVCPLLHGGVRYVVFSLKVNVVVAGDKLVQILRHALPHQRQLFSVVEMIWVHRHEILYVDLYVSARVDVSVYDVLRNGGRNRKKLFSQLAQVNGIVFRLLEVHGVTGVVRQFRSVNLEHRNIGYLVHVLQVHSQLRLRDLLKVSSDRLIRNQYPKHLEWSLLK